MATFLPPIEQPGSLSLKLAYALTRKVFGKVITPLKVHAARLPAAFGLLYQRISRLDRKLRLSSELRLLIREQVSRVNGCPFSMDLTRWTAQRGAMNQAKFETLPTYATSPLFTEAERAALDYVSELTRHRSVQRITFERMAAWYSEREVCEIVWLAASEHIYNITNIGLNIGSDVLCDTRPRRPTAPTTAVFSA
ncbi:MAG TPA: hypothetical protein VGI83_04765 [Gemmatimonadales bacterium]|jgi:alkylhydroperoxidase family enzyme